jgi:hypothetical protein
MGYSRVLEPFNFRDDSECRTGERRKAWREKVQDFVPRFVIIADNSHFLNTIR